MDISRSDALVLVTQVQKAHRLAVGFYQRILPALENVAHSLDTSFWYWQSSIFSRPAGRNSYPGKSWSWDLLPMSTPVFVFLRQDGPDMQISDLVVEFQLHLDPALTTASNKGQPDPLTLDEFEPTLEVFLYWPTQEAQGEFKAEWELTSYPTCPAGEVEVSGNMSAVKLEFPLADLVRDAGAIEVALKSYLPAIAMSN